MAVRHRLGSLEFLSVAPARLRCMGIDEFATTASAMLAILTTTGGTFLALKRWVLKAPLHDVGTRMDTYLTLANRLELMGESEWAAEQRKNGWLSLMRDLERYEYDRRTTWPFTLGGASLLSIMAGLMITVVMRSPSGSIAGMILVCLGSIGWVVLSAHQSRRSRSIQRAANERFDWHEARGDVTNFDRAWNSAEGKPVDDSTSMNLEASLGTTRSHGRLLQS